MTIALGILASDGLAIAADTQETMLGVWKLPHGKVSAKLASGMRPGGKAICLITGAGDGHHIDAISRQLRDAFAKHQRSDSDLQVQDEFTGILKNFYAEHVVPFAGYPPDQRPDFQLLIGCEAPSYTLFQSQGNVFTVENPIAAVGIGSMVALPLLARFYKLPMPDVRSAVLLALYVMFHVKESIEGCGKDTDIWGIHNGRFLMVPRRDSQELERAMSAFSADVEPLLFRGLTGIDSVEQRKASHKAQAQLKKLIAALKLP